MAPENWTLAKRRFLLKTHDFEGPFFIFRGCTILRESHGDFCLSCQAVSPGFPFRMSTKIWSNHATRFSLIYIFDIYIYIYICFMMIPWDHDSYHDSDDDHVNLWMINERLWAEEWNSFDEGWLPMITDDYYVWGVNRVCIVASPQRMLVWWVLSSFVPAHVTLRNTWFNLKNPGRNRLKRRFGNPKAAETRKARIMASGSIC